MFHVKQRAFNLLTLAGAAVNEKCPEISEADSCSQISEADYCA